MKSRLEELAHRRGSLVERAASERAELAKICRRFEGTTRFLDFGLRVIDLLKTHPVLVAGLTTLLASGRLKKIPLWALLIGKILSSGIGKPKGTS
ncbi:MAG: hypothetical protein HYT78_00110 [Deltaproteobacteria bacterium]|nr:hypothetical protein [Deltaproteobacteria bacterium]